MIAVGRVIGVASVVAVTAGLTSCAEPSYNQSSGAAKSLVNYVGKTFDVAAASMPAGLTVLVQDDSVLVGREPAYNGSQFGFPGWEVIALCADAPSLEKAKTVEFAVIPADAASGAIRREISLGKFAHAVSCEGLRYRGQPGTASPSP